MRTTGVIQALLLAAGASKRFGSNKLLEALPDGTPMLLRSAETLLAADLPVLAVLRRGDKAATKLLAPLAGVAVTECPHARAGMGHSLAWGVVRSGHADGWLVALADMPFLSSDTMRAVYLALEAGASIAAPAYQGQRGHPVGFSRRWRDDLLALTGDHGAQILLRCHPEVLTLVPCNDPGVLRDIDMPADLPA